MLLSIAHTYLWHHEVHGWWTDQVPVHQRGAAYLGHCWGLHWQQSSFPFQRRGLYPKMWPDSEQISWMHISTLWCWASGIQLGNQRFRHTALEAGKFFLSAKLHQKKRALIKNKIGKQKNPANTQEKKILCSFHWPNISCYSKNGDCKEVPLLQHYLNQIALNNLTPTFPPLASGYFCSLLWAFS